MSLDSKVINIVWQQSSSGAQQTRDDLNKTFDAAKKNQKEYSAAQSQAHNQFKKETQEKIGLLGEAGNEVDRLEHGVRIKMERIGEYVVAAFATEKVFEFAKACIDSAEEAEKSMNELKFAVLNIAKEGIEAFKKLQVQAKSLSDSTNTLFSHVAIEKVQAQLLRAGLTVDQVQKALPRLADIAAKTGKSLEDVGEGLSRAFSEGQTRALTEYGAKFETTGDRVKDFNIIMEKTKGYVGGAADAMGDLASQSQQSANKLEELQEKIGGELAPMWEGIKSGALQATQAVIDFFKSFSEGGREELKTEENARALTDALQANAGEMDDLRKMDLKSLDNYLLESDKLYQQAFQKYQQYKSDIESGVISNSTDNKKRLQDLHEQLDAAELSVKNTQQAIIDVKNKSNEKAHEGDVNLSKLTNEELQKRLKAVQDQDNEEVNELNKSLKVKQDVTDNYNAIGFEKEQSRINKEIKAREEAQKKILEMQNKFQEELGKASKIPEEASNELSEVSPGNEFDRKRAKENDDFQSKIDRATEEEDKLREIRKNGTEKQKQEAIQALKELDGAIEDFTKAHYIRMSDIDKQQADNELKEKQTAKKKEFEALKQELDNNESLNDADLTDQLTNKKITQKEYDKQERELKIKHLEDLLALEEQYGEDTTKTMNELSKAKADNFEKDEKSINEYIESFNKMTETILGGIQEQSEAIVESNNFKINQQDALIQAQEALAEKGLKNDLAFEIKRRDELTRQNLIEAQRQKKLKEFETLLNSFAEFSKQDPSTAAVKTAVVLAALKASEASYAEEGGIVGQNMPKAFGKRHKSGKDRLVLAEDGEAVLTRKEVAVLGGNIGFMKFKNQLHGPLIEKAIPMINVLAAQGNNEAVVERLNSLEKTLRQLPGQMPTVDVDKFGDFVDTRVKNGVKQITIHKRRSL